ncbi:hypothetical protein [Flavobacterium petrolei]|uniref:hypothetical protein n=1 Tax=Flavobacterium petrolei TaxID=2259594 RepID=UPI00375772E6
MNFVHEEEVEEDDFLLQDKVYGKHIMTIQDKLTDRLYKLVKEHNLTNEEIKKIVDLKRRELFAVLLPMIDEYEIKLHYSH